MLYTRTIYGVWLTCLLESLCMGVIGFAISTVLPSLWYKAQLVARGFTHEYSVDYEETFTLVARLSFVHTLLVFAASQH
jgi:hypothetical protein